MEKNSMIYIHSKPHTDENLFMSLQASVRMGLYLFHMYKINMKDVNYFMQGKFAIALLLFVC